MFANLNLNLDDMLVLKKRGSFRIRSENGQISIIVSRPGQQEEIWLARSPGHANQLRQCLSDAGLCGLIEGAA